MTSDVATKAFFRLGNTYFQLKHCNEEFHQTLERLMPLVDEVPPHGCFYDCDMGCSFDLRELLNHMLKRHFIHLWLDAATLVSPSGKKVLLAGKSSSGKSTTSMALALAFGWKVLSEDITLINPETRLIENFASPFSLKDGTIERLQETFGIDLGEPLLEEWIPLGDVSYGTAVPAKFDLAILFDLDQSTEFTIDSITAAEYTRKLLPYSNFVKQAGGMELFMELLGEANVLHITNGSLQERIEKICHLTGDSAQKTSVQLPTSIADTSRPPAAPKMVPWKPVRKKLRRHPDVKTDLLPDGHLVISDPESSWAYTLNPLGSIVWEFLDGNHTPQQIMDEIEQIEEIPQIENLQKEVSELLSELEESGLVLTQD